MEITSRIFMHTAHFYYLVSLVAPLVLAGVARASRFKWAATTVAGIYFVFVFLMGRILPLFPAEPKLGPVYHQVDAVHAARISAAPDRSRVCAGPDLATHGEMGYLAPGAGFGGGIRRRLRGRAVAVRELPRFSRGAQLVFRQQVFRLLRLAAIRSSRGIGFVATEAGAAFGSEAGAGARHRDLHHAGSDWRGATGCGASNDR